MKSNRVMSLAVLWMGLANLILITTNPVDRILSFTCAFWGIVFFVIAEVKYVKERRKRKASVYADWDIGFEELELRESWGSDPDLTLNLDFVANGDFEE